MSVPSAREDRRWIDADDRTFFTGFVSAVPGWLEEYAALRTMDLLALQENARITGPLLEIGVFMGRYFAVLLRSAVRAGERIVGVDTFQYFQPEEIAERMAGMAAAETMQFVRRRSVDLSADELRTILGGEPRFVSIDGSHERDDVRSDLVLCEEILAPLGIVAVDDFLNPVTLGVNDGVHRFFEQPRRLAPFAYTANKLFLSRPAAAARYVAAFESHVVADDREPRSAAFRSNLPAYRANVEQRLWGSTLLVVP
ncbi:MAG TPA: class I SAM-dependent methyltransferase [Candidatus Elarobacter sp.]|jgi:hypothetical protein